VGTLQGKGSILGSQEEHTASNLRRTLLQHRVVVHEVCETAGLLGHRPPAPGPGAGRPARRRQSQQQGAWAVRQRRQGCWATARLHQAQQQAALRHGAGAGACHQQAARRDQPQRARVELPVLWRRARQRLRRGRRAGSRTRLFCALCCLRLRRRSQLLSINLPGRLASRQAALAMPPQSSSRRRTEAGSCRHVAT